MTDWQWRTDHFSLVEMEESAYAARHGFRNVAPPEARESLHRLAVEVLEPLRAALGGGPLVITSGYRCERLNAGIGGAPRSAHMDGRAADIVALGGVPPAVVIETLHRASPEIAYDKAIAEFGRWTHVQVRRGSATPRRQRLLATRAGGRTVYSRVGV